MSPVDPLARHLALLLRVADLAGRIAPRDDDSETTSALLFVVRRATHADRVSLFETSNTDADSLDPMSVVRIARSTKISDSIRAEAPFHPAHVALLLSPIQTGTVEALGPIEPDEDFYEHHHHEEPTATKHAAFAPILVNGTARGVLEVARSDDSPFDEHDLAAIEAGARSISAAVWGARRETTMFAFLAALLPEILAPNRATTSLPDRVRQWLSSRDLDPTTRRAIALATTIAELAESSPASLELVQTVLSATRKAFTRDVAEWSEIDRDR